MSDSFCPSPEGMGFQASFLNNFLKEKLLKEMPALSTWVAGLTDGEGRPIGREIPLHISRFFPRFMMSDALPTPVADVRRLAEVARRRLGRVLVGNC